MPVFCTKCGAQNDDFAQSCVQCQAVLPSIGGQQTGYQAEPVYQQPYQPSYQPIQPPAPAYGQSPADWPAAGASKKIAAGICGILLGSFGVHKFILGYSTEGVIMLVVWLVGLVLCGIPSLVIQVIGIVEGITYLTKSDEEFVRTYIYGHKGWF